jgi:SAM-dependent methyltransferase
MVRKLLTFAQRSMSAARSSVRRRMPSIMHSRNYQPALPVPSGHTRKSILEALCSVSIDGSATGELRGYATADCERFLRTLNLVPEDTGDLLEIGGNPYFTTLLLRHFRPGYRLHVSNYFGGPPGEAKQHVRVEGFDGKAEEFEIAYQSLNVEAWNFPYVDGQFDVVLYCEVLEHMTNDPMHTLREISRVLKPGGVLVLTTPNAARLENVVAFIEGRNIYDPYSGYGPYGRHNREYTRHELHQLLIHCGFRCETSYTANVHPDIPPSMVNHADVANLLSSIRHREHDLGQYLFTRWQKARPCNSKLPSWLYRSYPSGEIAE